MRRQLTAASYQALTPNTTPTGALRTENFQYDQLGNRKGANTLAARGTVTFNRKDNGLNQYLNWSPYPITYDDSFAPQTPGHNNGNLRQDGWLSSDYNALNQPLWFWSNSVVPTGYGMFFGFDPLGRRVKQWDGATTTYFYYDGWNLIQEGPTALIADRIYAHGNRVDEIVADQAGGVWSYHHYDARGHCILLTDASGNLLEQYSYDAFGKVYYYDGAGNALSDSARGNRFLFTGREWLNDLRVYDFRNRHYLPELGRFIQPDPKEFEAGDYNLYRYCHNDPVNKADPTGLYRTDEAGIVQPETTKEFIEMGNAIERGNTMDTTPMIDPIDIVSGGIAGLLRSSARTLITSETRSAVVRSIVVKDHAFRELSKEVRSAVVKAVQRDVAQNAKAVGQPLQRTIKVGDKEYSYRAMTRPGGKVEVGGGVPGRYEGRDISRPRPVSEYNKFGN